MSEIARTFEVFPLYLKSCPCTFLRLTPLSEILRGSFLSKFPRVHTHRHLQLDANNSRVLQQDGQRLAAVYLSLLLPPALAFYFRLVLLGFD